MVPRYHLVNVYIMVPWYHSTITMKTYSTMEKKLSDWKLAFNSIDNQEREGQILNGLIVSLEKKFEQSMGVAA